MALKFAVLPTNPTTKSSTLDNYGTCHTGVFLELPHNAKTDTPNKILVMERRPRTLEVGCPFRMTTLGSYPMSLWNETASLKALLST
jgi:hypothetical protein